MSLICRLLKVCSESNGAGTAEPGASTSRICRRKVASFERCYAGNAVRGHLCAHHPTGSYLFYCCDDFRPWVRISSLSADRENDPRWSDANQTHNELAALVGGFRSLDSKCTYYRSGPTPAGHGNLSNGNSELPHPWDGDCELRTRCSQRHQPLLTAQAGTVDWHDQLPRLGVHGADRRRIDDVIQRFVDERRVVTVDREVANMTFTFWTNLVSQCI